MQLPAQRHSYSVHSLCGPGAATIGSLKTMFGCGLIAAVTFLSLTLPAVAATGEESALLQAEALSGRGEFGGVIRILEPVLHASPMTLDNATAGSAWNVLGSAYQDLGQYESARRSYEAASGLLRDIPSAKSSYATVLANLGSLYLSTDQWDAASALLQKARGLYSELQNHAGLAEAETTLATLAIARNDFHAAQSFLNVAFKEAESVPDLKASDWAAMYSIKGSLAARDRNFIQAIRYYQLATDFWIRGRGPKYYLVALEYTLKSDAYRELGDYNEADRNIKAALALLEETIGPSTPQYAITELTYARLLRATGSKEEARQKEAEATAQLKRNGHQQCAACTISAVGFR